MLELLALPFLACLVIVGIHCWLGLHVVERGIIFVDLALAQIAALGTAIALLLGHDVHDRETFALSLVLTVVGAALFAFGKLRDERVPHEAIIGIIYAVASALAILVLDRAPHGQEEVKNLLVGSILFVTPRDVTRLLVTYLVVGTVHFALRRRFLLISRDVERARREGLRVRLWDFVFYLTFGVVITNSVRVAGVLLVFSYLVVPAVCAVLLTDRSRARLLLGWGLGFTGSVVGLALSARWDLPTGAAIVAAFGGMVAVVLAVRPLLRRRAAAAH